MDLGSHLVYAEIQQAGRKDVVTRIERAVYYQQANPLCHSHRPVDPLRVLGEYLLRRSRELEPQTALGSLG